MKDMSYIFRSELFALVRAQLVIERFSWLVTRLHSCVLSKDMEKSVSH